MLERIPVDAGDVADSRWPFGIRWRKGRNVFSIVADETESFSNWTWRAALEWDVTEENFLFASFETGFKSGGFFFSNDSQVFQPEELEAFTLGSRNRLLDDRLQVDVEAFHWRYDDQQISTITQDSPGRHQPRSPAM